MSSDNKDIPDNEVVEPVDGEVDSGETESLDVETDALTEVEALQEVSATIYVLWSWARAAPKG